MKKKITGLAVLTLMTGTTVVAMRLEQIGSPCPLIDMPAAVKQTYTTPSLRCGTGVTRNLTDNTYRAFCYLRCCGRTLCRCKKCCFSQKAMQQFWHKHDFHRYTLERKHITGSSRQLEQPMEEFGTVKTEDSTSTD
jgi:hypothetical protein